MADLVGRDREIAQLSAGLDQALAGRGGLVLVSGEAGAGKSALVQAVLTQTPARVLTGYGIPGGASVYGPLAQAFGSYQRQHGGLTWPPDGPSDPGALAVTVRRMLAELAQNEPLVVVLDDLHWADDATLELLPELARSIDDLPLLMIGIVRSDELPRASGIRRLRAELRRAGLLDQIALEPLDEKATCELLVAHLGPVAPSLCRVVFDRTGGVPFFVGELAAALTGSGRLVPGPLGAELLAGVEVPLPESVRDAVLLRAAGVPDEVRAAVTVAAVAGQVFDPELVRDVAGLREWPDEVARLGLVHELEPGRFTFRHALIRDAFYSDIPWSRRVSLHQAVAQRLSKQNADPAVIAEHWARGRSPELARSANLAAAQAFAEVHAYRDAARHLRRALDQWPDGGGSSEQLEVLEQLAQCAELGGDRAMAIRVWREAADAWRLRDNPERLGAAQRRLAGVLELQGRWPESLASREQAAIAFTAAGQLADAATERLTAAAHLRSAGSFRAAVGLLGIAREQAHHAGRRDLEARIIGNEGNARARMGEGAPAVDQVRAALAMALDGGHTSAAADIYQRLADALEHTGDYAGAKTTYDEAYGFCSANALEPTAQLCRACLTAVLRQSGDLDRAVTLCREVIASADVSPHARTVAVGMYGSILGLRGQTDRARPMLLEAATLARQIELAAMEMLASWGLACIDQLDGATEAAAAHCYELIERWRRTEDLHYAISPLRWAATFFTETGDVEGARAAAAALAELAAKAGHDEAMSALAHALGETALLDGDLEQAVASFTRALALLAQIEAPLDRVESQRRAAAALIRLGRRDEAVDHLVAAYRVARRLEVRPMTEHLAGELADLGEKVDRRTGRSPAGPSGSLTRREIEVVRLVSLGRTNREIAKELFLSPRTVESHVSNIVLKLNCRSRADAVRVAAERGLLL